MSVANSFTQVILVKFISPSPTLGARFKASHGKDTVTASYDYSLSHTENYDAAAAALISKFNLPGRWVGGGLRENYVYVQVSP